MSVTNQNITTNNISITDSGTFTISGINDTVSSIEASSTITISPNATPSNEILYLGAVNSTVTDTTGTGDFIQGHGTDNVTVGQYDTVHLWNGQNETVTGGGDDYLLLGTSASDTVNLSGGYNQVNLGTGTSTVTISSGSYDAIDTNNAVSHTINITDNGTNTIIHAHDNTVTLNGSANYMITAQDLGNHVLSLSGTGDDTVFIRNGTINAHINTFTINGFVDGTDAIVLTQGAEMLSSAASILSHITNVNGNATLTLGGETVTFIGVTASALHASDFHVV